MKKYLLGIDVGTTGTKSMLFSETGEILGHAYEGYPCVAAHVGWSEQNAEHWWTAVKNTVNQLCKDREIAENVAAISLSLQGGTIVPVDENCNPLRPAIVWNDSRCAEQKAAFLREVGEESLMYQCTGWALSSGLPALAIRWIWENEPEIFAKTKMFLSVPDYISVKMTGIAAIDPSDAGINQLSNIRQGEYEPKLLEFAGITEKTDLKILVTLSCTMCPDLVVAAQRIAAANPNVTAHIYDIRHFETLKAQYNVMSVPCMVINNDKVFFGKKNVTQLLTELLG